MPAALVSRAAAALLGLDVQLCAPSSLTFIVVVLHSEDPALGSTGTVKNELLIQGLDGERVQHANVVRWGEVPCALWAGVLNLTLSLKTVACLLSCLCSISCLFFYPQLGTMVVSC